jgi:hypothetical protein
LTFSIFYEYFQHHRTNGDLISALNKRMIDERIWFARDKQRVEFLNRIQRMVWPLLSVSFALIIGVTSSHAAYLKDIRVGEYEDHTRIVFELSAATAIERIIPQDPGQLTVVFADTQPQLTRKIPIERSTRVKKFKLWSRHESLSSVLNFTFDHFRYELTEFENPVRIALDVYELPSTPLPPVSAQPKAPNATASGTLDPTAQLPVLPEDSPLVTPQPSTQAPVQAPLDEKTAVELNADQPAGSSAQNPTAEAVPDKPKADPLGSPPAASSGFSRMQFYLVVGLVILTMVILALLLLMLLSRQRWTNDDTSLHATDFLHSQDKRMAALDAQIQEQLKRYDEA